jgi:membrane-bound metal-dependent hydrolase YbcI (DUF457 family)
MANFNTHISTSAILGVGYGAVGHLVYGLPLTSSILAAGLCTVAGILPDADADRGHTLRELMAFLAAVVPLLLLHRVNHLGLPHETLVLMGAGVYLFIRFLVANTVRRLTIHRGMWHSLPAALIAGLVAFWLCGCPERRVQIFKAAAVVTGYVWHLVLDEIYAVDTSGYQPRAKRSFGTAIKVFGHKPLPNVFVYGLLFLMLAVVINEETLHPTATTTPEPAVSESSGRIDSPTRTNGFSVPPTSPSEPTYRDLYMP